MAPKQAKPQAKVSPQSSETGQQSAQPVESIPLSERATDRLSAALKADGSFDLEAMRPGTRERFLKALQATRVPGSSGGPSPEAVREMTALAHGLCEMVSQISMRAARLAGYSEAQASIMLWSETDRKTVVPSLSLVLVRHQDLLVNAPEVMLVSALATVVGGKIIEMKKSAVDVSPQTTARETLDDHFRHAPQVARPS